MNTIHINYYKTAYGELKLGVHDNSLIMCDWRYRKMRERIDQRLQRNLNAIFIEEHHSLFDITKQQLAEYFENTRNQFDIPLALIGTEFQKTVWNGLLQIPYGKTSSYLDLASSIGNSQAVRAVANANGANAISIIIPCHRVIGTKGELTGYAGGLPAKKKLLDLENNLFS